LGVEFENISMAILVIIGVKTSFLLRSCQLLYYSVSTSPFGHTWYDETEEIWGCKCAACVWFPAQNFTKSFRKFTKILTKIAVI